jgi:predicted transcriptional regulator
MTLSGRPLLDTRPDSELFVDRVEEIGRVRAALSQSLNCLVVGERGTGKTSLVRALMFRSRQDGDQRGGRPPELVYVHGAGADGAAGLLVRVADAIGRQLGELPPATPRVLGDGGSRDATELIAELGERASRRDSIVIALDDAPAGAGNALFGTLRDELWSIDLRWLVTVATSEKGVLMRPPADAFFESQVELGPLAVSDSIEILRRRMNEVPEPLLAEAARIGAGNPRRLLDVARELGGDYSQWSAFSLAASQRQKALASLGRSAQMLAHELEQLGGASASDEQLLSRMGWTRPRVVQVLAEMEQTGLVTASRQKSGQGRPRKVYKVVSPGQFVQQRLAAGTRANDQTHEKTPDEPESSESPA